MALSIITALLVAGQAGSGALALELPIGCNPGRTCWIQKYPDVADGPERRDFRCGAITTDGHDGIDFRIASLSEMRRGVPVLAAASGTVLRIRDGEPDVSIKERGGTGREAGNGVVIDHGNGWETQYSHLRRGSVSVRPGQKIEAGARIGLVGLSGDTEYPHLHFALRRAGAKMDPFTGAVLPSGCSAATAHSLWSEAAASKLPYASGQIVRLAITTAPQPVPLVADPTAPSRHDPLVIVADVIAPQPGDVHRFELIGPQGRQILSRQGSLDRSYLDWGPYSGMKAPAGGWPAGRYVGRLVLVRNGREIARAEQAVTLR